MEDMMEEDQPKRKPGRPPGSKSNKKAKKNHLPAQSISPRQTRKAKLKSTNTTISSLLPSPNPLQGALETEEECPSVIEVTESGSLVEEDEVEEDENAGRPEEDEDVGISGSGDYDSECSSVESEKPVEVLKLVFQVPVEDGTSLEKLVVRSDSTFVSFRVQVAEMMKVRLEDLSLSYKMGTRANNTLPHILKTWVHWGDLIDQMKTDYHDQENRKIAAKEKGRKFIGKPLEILLVDNNQENKSGGKKTKEKEKKEPIDKGGKGVKKGSGTLPMVPEASVPARKNWVLELQIRYKCQSHDVDCCFVGANGVHLTLTKPDLSLWATMIEHNRANIDEPPTALGQLVPRSAHKKKNENNPTTNGSIPIPPSNLIPPMFPQTTTHAVPSPGYPYPSMIPGMPFGTPYPMMPVPYFPPSSSYSLPKDLSLLNRAQKGAQSNNTSPSNNPTSDDFDFEDPRDFPDVRTWFAEHDARFADVEDGHQLALYIAPLTEKKYTRISQLADLNTYQELIRLCPEMPEGTAQYLHQQVRRKVTHIRKKKSKKDSHNTLHK